MDTQATGSREGERFTPEGATSGGLAARLPSPSQAVRLRCLRFRKYYKGALKL